MLIFLENAQLVVRQCVLAKGPGVGGEGEGSLATCRPGDRLMHNGVCYRVVSVSEAMGDAGVLAGAIADLDLAVELVRCLLVGRLLHVVFLHSFPHTLCFSLFVIRTSLRP